MADDPRVPLLSRAELPEEYQSLFDTDALGELNLFQAMAHTPRAMKAYMRYGTALWNAGTLSTRERELAILSVARTLRSEYEWHQHVGLGRDAGISDAELDALAQGDTCGLTAREQAIAHYASAVATGSVTGPVFEAVVEVTDTETAVGLTMLAGHYLMTARILDALSVPVDGGTFVGWAPGTGRETGAGEDEPGT